MADNITLNAAVAARTRTAQETLRTARTDLTKRDNARALVDVNARKRIQEEDRQVQNARLDDTTVNQAQLRGNQRAARDNLLTGDVIAGDARLRQTQNDLTAELNVSDARRAEIEAITLNQQDNTVLNASGNVLPSQTEQDNTINFGDFLQQRDSRLVDNQQQDRDRDVQSRIDTRLALDRIASPDATSGFPENVQRGVLVDIIS